MTLPDLLPPEVRDARQAALAARAAALGADALLLSHLPDVRWATGFSGSNALVLAIADRLVLVTDGRYGEQARRECPGIEIRVPGYDLVGAIDDVSGKTVVLQEDHITVASAGDIVNRHPDATWINSKMVLDELVAVKTDAEIERIEAAQRITETVFDELCERIVQSFRQGEIVTERHLGAHAVYGHLRRGCERVAFDPIVASGPNGALPHARPSDRALREGDLVVIDMGGVVDGYASDMTRTVAVGEPGDEARETYAAVLAAHDAAVEAARSGMTGRELDGVARAVLDGAGLGEAFSHGLGHGVGLQTHEWPRVSYTRDDVLPAGCVVTIEPGAYLPGRFGVRIEDMIHLSQSGARRLTRCPRDLVVL